MRAKESSAPAGRRVRRTPTRQARLSERERPRFVPRGAAGSTRRIGAVAAAARRATGVFGARRGAELHSELPLRGRDTCSVCGSAARVRVLEGYSDGEPVHRHFCLTCADDPPALEGLTARSRPRLYRLILLVGVASAIAPAVWNYTMPPQLTPGLGIHKGTVMFLGAVVLSVGAFTGVELVMLAGVGLFAASLMAAMSGIPHNVGFGWKDQLVLSFAAVCIVIALAAQIGFVRRAWMKAKARLRHLLRISSHAA